MKDVHDLYAENYETLLGKTKEDSKEDTIVKDWKTYCGQESIIPQFICGVSTILIRIPLGF